jgi:dipeptidyl aminopeptidase/acylaminoacyl peptidase
MNIDGIREVAWVGDEYVQGPLRGLILNFHGLGGGHRGGPSTEELAWAEAGGLIVHPYTGPWSWMNRESRAFVDGLVEDARAAFGLPAEAPLVCNGGSMGGLSSLLYTRYAAHPVAACMANCPVCDLRYHFSERPDLPATIRCAYRGYPEPFDAVLAEHSPLCQVDGMPDIPYLIVHGEQDPAVSKAHHSDPMVAAMRARGLNVTYREVAVMKHCGPMPLSVLQEMIEFVRAPLEPGSE